MHYVELFNLWINAMTFKLENYDVGGFNVRRKIVLSNNKTVKLS